MRPTVSRITIKRHAAFTTAMLAAGLFAAACGSAAADDGDRAIADIPETSLADANATPNDADAQTNDGGDDTSADDEPLTEEEAEAAQLRFEQCLADEGVENPFSDAGDGDGSAVVEFDEGEFEKFEAAQETCEPILEEAFGSFELTPEQEAAQADAELAFNTCMADKGFDMESSDGEGFEVGEDVDIDDLQAAAEECDDAFNEVFGDADGATEEGDDQ